MSYCPYTKKYQLVDWLVKSKGWKKSHAQRKTYKQLLAIYYSFG